MRLLLQISNLYKNIFWSLEKRARANGVKIGENCCIYTPYFGTEPYLIEIGNHVQITNDVRFFTHGGSWVFRKQYPDMDTFGKIRIGDNVYIGSCSLILPGVTIGSNCVIGAGSVVTKSVKKGTIVAGNPARVIGEVNTLLENTLKFNLGSKFMSDYQKKEYLLSLSDEKFIKK